MDVKLKRDIILDNYQNPQNKGLPNDDSYEKVNSKNESCVDNITIAAKVVDGVLHIELPKKTQEDELKKQRNIAID